MSFSYFRHEDIDQPFRLRVLKVLDPNKILDIYDDPDSSLAAISITVKLFVNRTLISETTEGIIHLPQDFLSINFDFPFLIQDLPPETYISIYIWSTSRAPSKVPAASTCLSVFEANLTSFEKKHQIKSGGTYMRQGTYKLLLHPDKSPDIRLTPGISENVPGLPEIYKLSNNIEKFDQNLIQKEDWLDAKSLSAMDSRIPRMCEENNLCLLEIELPRFINPVMYEENLYPLYNLNYWCDTQDTRLCIVPDYEVIYNRTNPIAEMYSRLIRNVEVSHKDLRPTEEIKEKLLEIIHLPDHKPLSPEQNDLIWLYRYSLLENKLALTKFLHATCWDNQRQEAEALKLMNEWSPIEKEEALHLLSQKYAFNNHYSSVLVGGIGEVRKYAVSRLATCSDDEIHSILLQLVQALRYEDFNDSPLEKFLIERAIQCREIAITLHWMLIVECVSPKPNRFIKTRYENIFKAFSEALGKLAPSTVKDIREQQKLKDKLATISKEVKKNKGDTSTADKKKAKLRSMLAADSDIRNKHVRNFINPQMVLCGVIPSECSIFSSKLCPMKISFKTENDSVVALMYKNGDDLRQDQLIIQMIRLMDKLLKDVNLDMELMPYNVLATSATEGFAEFVQNSSTIYDRIQKKQQLSQYLLENKDLNPRNEQTFIKSCAGYCVITYLLGIGDRHLENLMIDNKGHLFHIDFGFILGKDPKPMPPPMKLCKEMIDTMGEGYDTFRTKCVEVFMHLRKHCKLIVNLFYLMIHSGLTGLAGDSMKILDKLYERFKIGMSDDEAEHYILELVSESANALMPQIMEKFHVWANYWRRK